MTQKMKDKIENALVFNAKFYGFDSSEYKDVRDSLQSLFENDSDWMEFVRSAFSK